MGIHIDKQSRSRKGIVTASSAYRPIPPLSDWGNHTEAGAPARGSGSEKASGFGPFRRLTVWPTGTHEGLFGTRGRSPAPGGSLHQAACTRGPLAFDACRRPGPGATLQRMETVLSVIQVAIAVIVIFLVLMHSGKDSGLSGAFGVGSGTGPLGGGSMVERNLNRWTIFFAILFFVNAIILLKRPWA